MVGWLVLVQALNDYEVNAIIADNKVLRDDGGHIGKYIQACYHHALILKLRDMTTKTSADDGPI